MANYNVPSWVRCIQTITQAFNYPQQDVIRLLQAIEPQIAGLNEAAKCEGAVNALMRQFPHLSPRRQLWTQSYY